jgi:hypothetical protein
MSTAKEPLYIKALAVCDEGPNGGGTETLNDDTRSMAYDVVIVGAGLPGSPRESV